MCGLGPEQHFGHCHRQGQAEALLEPRKRGLRAWAAGGSGEGGSGGWAGPAGGKEAWVMVVQNLRRIRKRSAKAIL